LSGNTTRQNSQRNASRILVVAPQWIGDCVMAEPFLALLREHHPAAYIAVMALPHIAPVLRAMPQIDEVIELPFQHGKLQWGKRRALARKLHERIFDVAYVLPNSLKSALVPWMAGIKRRVGYQGEGRYFLLNEKLPNPRDKRPLMTAFYGKLADADFDAFDKQAQPVLSAAPARRDSACAMHGVSAETPYLVLAPGAEYGPAKQWPVAHFREIALTAGAQGFNVLVMGGPKDSELGTEIAQGLSQVKNLCGLTSLDDAIAIISGAEGMVSNDSGLMHVAAALKVPTIGIYGSTSPHHTPPAAHRSTTLWIGPKGAYGEPGVACSPCFERVCRFEGDEKVKCLKHIKPALVWDTLRQL
jgi:heptosyltransferase II